MPSKSGPMNINSVSGGVVNVGALFIYQPKTLPIPIQVQVHSILATISIPTAYGVSIPKRIQTPRVKPLLTIIRRTQSSY